MSTPTHVCAHCRAALASSPVPCDKCGEALWCSVECKRATRKAHKLVCLAPQHAQDDRQGPGAGAVDENSARCCDHCGAQQPELLLCSGCDAAYYCTTECQHGAWLGHKKACRAVQKQRKAAQEEAAHAQQADPACDVCGVQSPEVFACPACELAHYCSKEHQHDAWRGHKKACRQAAQKQAQAQQVEEPEPDPTSSQQASPTPVESTSQPAVCCGLCGVVSDKLLICSGCKLWRYCSADHQKQHWSTHKPDCRRIAAEIAAREENDPKPTAQLALPAPPGSKSTIPVCGFCGTANEKLLLCGKCKAMRYCSPDHQKQHWALHKITCAAPTPPQPKAVLSEKQNLAHKSIESGVASLRSNLSDRTRIFVALCGLVPLVLEKDNCRHFAQLGGAGFLLDALRSHSADAGICTFGFQIVGNMWDFDELLVKTLASGGLDVLFEAQRKHLMNALVNEPACWMLGTLARNSDENKVTIVARGGLELIFAALRNHPTHAGVNQFACAALGNLACITDNKVVIVARGGLELIFTALRNHPTHAGVNQSACAALGNLACFTGNKILIAARGGLELIFLALRNHPTHADVNQYACVALGNLVFNDESKLTVVARGGLDWLFAALRNHPTHAGVNNFACLVLANLASNDENKMLIAARGGLDWLFAALRNHPTHTGVNQFACGALANLACIADNKVTIVARGGLELIFAALRNHPTHADVDHYACLALANLSLNDENKMLIAARGGLDLLFAALRNHPTHADVNLWACSALSNLAANADNQVAIVALGGLDALFAALHSHPTHADVNRWACSALSNLTCPAENKMTFVARGGLELILAALRNHPTHADVNNAAVSLLANIAVSHRVAIEQSGAVAVVQDIMGRFPDDAKIQSECRRFFDSF